MRRLFPVLGLVIAVVPAGAAGTVTMSATRVGSSVQVTGKAVLADGPLVTIAVDPGGDVGAVSAQAAGDLTRVSLVSENDGDLVVRWWLVSLSGEPNGTAALGRFRFKIGDATYEIAAARNDYSGGSTNPGGWMIRCGSATCVPLPVATKEAATVLTRDVGVVLDFNADYIQAVVPSGTLGGVLRPGTLIEPLGGGEASTATGQLEHSVEQDTATMTGAYRHGLTVTLGVGALGADPPTIAYDVEAEVSEDNVTFTGALDVPDGAAVFARACLGGSSNCAYGSAEVGL